MPTGKTMEASIKSEGRGLLEKLRRNELVTAMMIRSARTPDVVRVAHSTGHQCIIVDLEHSTMSLDAAAAMTATAHDLGLFPFVRVPERDYGSIGRCLDGGASGIVAARIETAEQAAEIARACRFAPRGQRSQIAMVPQLGFAPTPARVLNPLLDQSAVVQVLIETPLGVSNADAIAQTDGVDMLAIGANDLSAELGIPGDFQNPRIRECIATVASACAGHGKLCVIGGISDLALVREYLSLGVAPLIISGSDIEMLSSAAKLRSDTLKKWYSETIH
jgi:2-keto-3-deoxy-L-rhamnonate aldolase RhmA